MPQQRLAMRLACKAILRTVDLPTACTADLPIQHAKDRSRSMDGSCYYSVTLRYDLALTLPYCLHLTPVPYSLLSLQSRLDIDMATSLLTLSIAIHDSW